MAITEVTAKAVKVGKTGVVGYNFGENLDEAAKIFTPELVHNGFVSHGVVQLQAMIRRALEANQNPVELAKSWKPGMKVQISKNPTDQAHSAWANMSDEERKIFLKKVKSM